MDELTGRTTTIASEADYKGQFLLRLSDAKRKSRKSDRVLNYLL